MSSNQWEPETQKSQGKVRLINKVKMANPIFVNVTPIIHG